MWRLSRDGNTDMMSSGGLCKSFDLIHFKTDPLLKFALNVCRDESDSRYKVPTFHIIFYSWQRRWAEQAGSCKEGGICNGL